MTLQQREDILRGIVGRGQNGGSGLHENLVARQIGGFRGEIRVGMSLSLEVTFSSAICKLAELVCRVFFSNAPSRPCNSATCWIAALTILLAFSALPLTTDALPPVAMSLRNPTALFPRRWRRRNRCRCSPAAGC